MSFSTNELVKTTNYDAIADEYIKTENSAFRKYMEKATILAVLGNIKGKSVLDLACGLGNYTRAAKKLGADRVVGVDSSTGMIYQAKLLEEKQALGVEYLTQDVTLLEQLGSFDIVTAIYLLPYAQTKKALSGMFRAAYNNLRKGGRLVALTVNPSLAGSSVNYFTALKKYGVDAEVNGSIQDGTPIDITLRFNTQDREINIVNYYWSQETHEISLREIGFSKIKWHRMIVSKEGIEKNGTDYWQDYLAYPNLIVLECHK